MVTRNRRGHPSSVEWHDRRRRIPQGRLSVPASRHYGAYHRGLAQRAERQPGIRLPATWLAKDARLAIGRRRYTSDTDCTRIHDPGILRCLVRSAPGMGAARRCEVPDDQALVGGTWLHPLERQCLAGELRDGDVYGQHHHCPAADRRLRAVEQDQRVRPEAWVSLLGNALLRGDGGVHPAVLHDAMRRTKTEIVHMVR